MGSRGGGEVKKIGVLRGLFPRLSQAEFAGSFTKFSPVFLSGEADDEINVYCRKGKLAQRDLRNSPLYGFDPVSLLGRRHQSWVGVEGLLAASKGLSVLETYELYHFFSGQAVAVAKQLAIPLVTEVWTSFAHHPAYYLPPYSLHVREVLRSSDLLIARSERAKTSLLRLGAKPEKVKMIYHGVNLERFVPKRRQFSQRVLYVGELEAYKGVHLLLSVWKTVLQKFSNAELILVGKGSLADIALRVPNVRVLGYVPHEQLPEVYSSADIFVSMSQNRYLGPFLWWEEFFSYTLMEAMGSGLPIIGSNSGGIPEEIGSENWIVEQGAREQLIERLVEALSRPEYLRELGKKNRKRAERLFDLKKQTGLLEREMEKLI
jgi:glycosyltransferase involved in cell wall biosynthesis